MPKAARACFNMFSIGASLGPLRAGKAKHHVQALPPFYPHPDSLHIDVG